MEPILTGARTGDTRIRPPPRRSGQAPGLRAPGPVPQDRGVRLNGDRPMTAPRLGSLAWLPAAEHPELLGAAVAAALPQLPGPAWVAGSTTTWPTPQRSPRPTRVPPEVSANCVVVAARRAGQTTLAACIVLATTRADVNGLVRRHLGARKASFAPQDVAVAETGMAYGGITPVGLPADWPVLVDAAVAAADLVVIGSGTRGSKLAVPGRARRPADRRGARRARPAAARRSPAPACSGAVARARRQRRRLGRAAARPG